MDLTKYTKNYNRSNIFHSNGITGSSSFGSASPQTFSERQRIEKSRKHIKQYKNSHIVRGSKPARSSSIAVTPEASLTKAAKPDANIARGQLGGAVLPRPPRK